MRFGNVTVCPSAVRDASSRSTVTGIATVEGELHLGEEASPRADEGLDEVHVIGGDRTVEVDADLLAVHLRVVSDEPRGVRRRRRALATLASRSRRRCDCRNGSCSPPRSETARPCTRRDRLRETRRGATSPSSVVSAVSSSAFGGALDVANQAPTASALAVGVGDDEHRPRLCDLATERGRVAGEGSGVEHGAAVTKRAEARRGRRAPRRRPTPRAAHWRPRLGRSRALPAPGTR